MFMSFAIREATEKDILNISVLIQENTDQVTTNNYSSVQKKVWKIANEPEQIKQQLMERQVFCCFQGEALVGVIGLKETEVVGLYVDHRQLGKGIGKRLLLHLESYAREMGARVLTLSATPAGRPFYEKNGFVSVENVDVIIDNTVFVETLMRKVLS